MKISCSNYSSVINFLEGLSLCQRQLGWGRGAGGGGGFSFSADLGVAIVDPGVDFEITGNAAVTNGYDQAILNAILKDPGKDAEGDPEDFER